MTADSNSSNLDNCQFNSSQSNSHASKWQRLHPQSEAMDATVDSATLTPDNRGLAYGDGFFTTIGVIDGLILWQDYHYQRRA